MKRYIHATSNQNTSIDELSIPIRIDIEVIADHLIFHEGAETDPIVAAKIIADAAKYNIPTGPVISKYKARVTQRMVDDFNEFVEIIEDLCETKYGLIMTYQNTSEDHSHYYNYLVTDDHGNIIVDFRLRLRVSNHPPKKSKEQKEHKKEELASDKLHELLTQSEIDKLTKYPKIITVNDELYDSYEQAFEDVDAILADAAKKMKKNAATKAKRYKKAHAD